MHPDVAPLLLVRECMPDQLASLGTAACVVDKAGNGMALSSWSASDATGAVTVGVVAKGTHQNSMAQGSFPVQPVKMKFTSDMTQVSQTLSVRGDRIKSGVPVVSVMVHGIRKQPLSGN